MEAILGRENMMAALRRVVANKGAPGADGMPVEALRAYLVANWPRIKEDLLAGRYRPSPVRGVEIPKPGGGKRLLGIPTVLDRLIQQAMHQVLMPLFDPGFSGSSFGFRPGRSAHQAVLAARSHMAPTGQARGLKAYGRRWVVDIDLEKFFDRVNHDVLMARVARQVADKRVLRLIRRYLQAGLLLDGLATARREGTPQGGPLSPLLSNILLDDLDKELERRGHAFCRYADDCNIYVRSRRAGERLMASLTGFLAERLRLAVNLAKSAVDRPWKRTDLPWLHRDRPQGAAPSGGGDKRGSAAGQAAGSVPARARPLRRAHRRIFGTPAARLAPILPAGAGKGRLRGTRRLVAAQAALHPVAPVEATAYPRHAAEATGS